MEVNDIIGDNDSRKLAGSGIRKIAFFVLLCMTRIPEPIEQPVSRLPPRELDIGHTP